MSPTEAFLKKIDLWWPYIYSWMVLVIGLVLAYGVWRSYLCGYIYPDIKYELSERRRIYREDEPFSYWLFTILYGAGSLFLIGFGIVAVLRVYSQ